MVRNKLAKQHALSSVVRSRVHPLMQIKGQRRSFGPHSSFAALQLRDVTGNDNPMLGQKTANLVDESDPVGDQAAANAMDGLHRQLIG